MSWKKSSNTSTTNWTSCLGKTVQPQDGAPRDPPEDEVGEEEWFLVVVFNHLEYLNLPKLTLRLNNDIISSRVDCGSNIGEINFELVMVSNLLYHKLWFLIKFPLAKSLKFDGIDDNTTLFQDYHFLKLWFNRDSFSGTSLSLSFFDTKFYWVDF